MIDGKLDCAGKYNFYARFQRQVTIEKSVYRLPLVTDSMAKHPVNPGTSEGSHTSRSSVTILPEQASLGLLMHQHIGLPAAGPGGFTNSPV